MILAGYFAALLIFAVAFVAIIRWMHIRPTRVIFGGIALFFVSFIPYIYARWITPSEWHDHALMIIYAWPTVLGVLIALAVTFVGTVAMLLRLLRYAITHLKGHE